MRVAIVSNSFALILDVIFEICQKIIAHIERISNIITKRIYKMLLFVYCNHEERGRVGLLLYIFFIFTIF